MNGPSHRRSTATSSFGVGRRENHDATRFYARFPAPDLTDDDLVVRPDDAARRFRGACIHGDARSMDEVPDGSVALVVTSPPYFAGKEYEEHLGRDGVPSSYVEYLQMLRDVFEECVRKLEPGGRIAVNVANLGRKPYRSLSSDVIRILQDDLRLLLRGEIVWVKARGAGGSAAWGSYRSAANPVLRDVTERIVVASKGRFDRARSRRRRRAEGLPHRTNTTADEFLAATIDVWEIPPESARRVQHPAPFPVELPQRLIRLYTYEEDLVLDPFMGSGSTLVAALRQGRLAVGYDLDPDYVEVARRRVAEEAGGTPRDAVPTDPSAPIQTLTRRLLVDCGFDVASKPYRPKGLGVQFPISARDRKGARWVVDVIGGYTTTRDGLRRGDAAWRALGRAVVLREGSPGSRLLLVTPHLPVSGSDADRALRAAGPRTFFDAIDPASPGDQARLTAYAAGAHRPLPGFWSAADLSRAP